jgi:hypothetical protein
MSTLPLVRRAQNCCTLSAEYLQALAKILTDPYRPERYYMRGPGPKWHLIDAGYIHIPQLDILALEDAVLAHRMIETGHVRGKLVLKVAELCAWSCPRVPPCKTLDRATRLKVFDLTLYLSERRQVINLCVLRSHSATVADETDDPAGEILWISARSSRPTKTAVLQSPISV